MIVTAAHHHMVNQLAESDRQAERQLLDTQTDGYIKTDRYTSIRQTDSNSGSEGVIEFVSE